MELQIIFYENLISLIDIWISNILPGRCPGPPRGIMNDECRIMNYEWCRRSRYWESAKFISINILGWNKYCKYALIIQ